MEISRVSKFDYSPLFGAKQKSPGQIFFQVIIFQRFFCEKFKLNFFHIFMILCRINKGVYSFLFGHTDTRKHVYEHCCSSVMVFLSILAHLAYLAQYFFFGLKCEKWKNILIYSRNCQDLR